MKSKKDIKKKKQEQVNVELKTQSKDPIQTRREFLNKLWKGLGVVAFIELTAVFFGYLFSGKSENENLKPKQLFDAGNINAFQKKSVTIFRSGRFYLVRLDDGGFLALSLRCTHLGCSINWEEDKKRFICPCHASAFEINGNVQNPPAPSALDYFPVIIQSGRVMVDIGTKLSRNRFSKDQVTYV
ncbi:MAG: Rieske (2Fe-2S) protein [Ignavibacteriaceae bacterium]|nr:Rieske (2Fe-2S) protein [Ignavibacteriaceae bacterium]